MQRRVGEWTLVAPGRCRDTRNFAEMFQASDFGGDGFGVSRLSFALSSLDAGFPDSRYRLHCHLEQLGASTASLVDRT